MPSKKSLTRRDFGKLAAGAPSSPNREPLHAATTETAKSAKLAPLDIAEWSFFWVGVENVTLPGGTSPAVPASRCMSSIRSPPRSGIPFPIF